MNKKNRGFTLIELLVVISIISLLASIILAGIAGARTKSEDARKSSIMTEYEKAMALYFAKYGSYPYDSGGIPPGTPNTTIYCIGDYSDNSCGWNNNWSEDALINTAYKEFIALPTLQPILSPTTGLTFEGPAYQCTAVSGSSCTAANIRWFTDTYGSCPARATPATISGLTRCIYYFP